MDIHPTFAESVMIDGNKLIRLGRVNMTRDHLAAFAAKLKQEDHIIVEATGNAQAVLADKPALSRWCVRTAYLSALRVSGLATARKRGATLSDHHPEEHRPDCAAAAGR